MNFTFFCCENKFVMSVELSQVQRNDQLKSVFGPGLQRNYKAEEMLAAANVYRQGFDENGVIALFYHLNYLNVHQFVIKRFYLSFIFKLIQFRRIIRKR